MQLAGGAGGETGADGSAHATSSVRVGRRPRRRALPARRSRLVDGGEHVAGEGRGDGQFAATGVGHGQAPGGGGGGGAGTAPVELVAADGRANSGQMDADLVGATGEGLRQDEGAFASGGVHLVLGTRTATGGRHGHPAAIGVAAPEVGFDHGAVALGDAVAEGEILLVGLTGLEGGAEGRLGGRRLGQQEDAARVLVEAVYDAGPLDIEDGRFHRAVLDEPGRDAGGAGLGGGGRGRAGPRAYRWRGGRRPRRGPAARDRSAQPRGECREG